MLEIRDLVKVHPGPVPALLGVSLDLPEGTDGDRRRADAERGYRRHGRLRYRGVEGP